MITNLKTIFNFHIRIFFVYCNKYVLFSEIQNLIFGKSLLSPPPGLFVKLYINILIFQNQYGKYFSKIVPKFKTIWADDQGKILKE